MAPAAWSQRLAWDGTLEARKAFKQHVALTGVNMCTQTPELGGRRNVCLELCLHARLTGRKIDTSARYHEVIERATMTQLSIS